MTIEIIQSANLPSTDKQKSMLFKTKQRLCVADNLVSLFVPCSCAGGGQTTRSYVYTHTDGKVYHIHEAWAVVVDACQPVEAGYQQSVAERLGAMGQEPTYSWEKREEVRNDKLNAQLFDKMAVIDLRSERQRLFDIKKREAELNSQGK